MTTATKADLIAIVETISTLTEPKRWIDALVWKTFVEKEGDFWDDSDDGIWMRRDPEDHVAFDMPPYLTSCLTAVETFVDEILPGYGYQLIRKTDGKGAIAACSNGTSGLMIHGQTTALALLAAAVLARANAM